jgi:hypothetical protein
MPPPPDPLEPCYLVTRSDLVAAFRLWNETWNREPETVEQVMARYPAGTDAAEAQTDAILAFLDEAARSTPVAK